MEFTYTAKEWPADGKCVHRCRDLAQLIGISDTETRDFTLSGRLSIITKLQAAKRAEIERGKTGSWLYDLNRHLALCACLRSEYEALSAYLASPSHASAAFCPLKTETALHDL